MHIFISPDRTQLPELPNSQACNDLEQVTGADIAISQIPIPPTVNVPLHIEKRTLFVQIKIGYDILSFDALHNFCARIQKCQIPKTQAVLLRIGEYWEDENSLLRVKHSKPYGNTTWSQYHRSLIACDVRGVNVVPSIRSIDDLPQWIEDRVAIHQKIEDEPKREIYPPRIEPVFEVDDIWQLVEEVPPDTIDYLLCAGFKGFGQKTMNAVRQYFQDELPHLPAAGHYALSALIDMENNKLKHNIPGWGLKRAQKLRDILLLPDNVNLGLNGKIAENEYKFGWQSALNEFKKLIDEGHSVKDAFNAVRKMEKYIIDF